MKKIMFAVAVGMLTFVTQAAAVNWTASNIYAGDGSSTKGSGYVGYMFLADQIASAAVSTAITDGKWGDVSKFALAEQYSTSAGKFTGAKEAIAIAQSYGGTEQAAYAVIFNAGSVDKATSFYMTESLTKTIGGTGGTSYGFGSLADSEKATWSKVGGVTPPGPVTPDVPEPTSGLLLVLGGAALALRRKQK